MTPQTKAANDTTPRRIAPRFVLSRKMPSNYHAVLVKSQRNGYISGSQGCGKPLIHELEHTGLALRDIITHNRDEL